MQNTSSEVSESVSPVPPAWRVFSWSVLSSVLLLSGCSNDSVPVTARLSLTPETHSTHIIEQRSAQGLCLFDPEHYLDIPIVLQLSTQDGSPIGDAELNVYVDFAENTYSGLSTLKLYDDVNSNGVIDGQSEYISGFNDDIARVNTDRWTGSRLLLMRINLSCAFRGEVFAFVGSVSSRATIEVVADEIVQPEVMIDEEQEPT